MRSFILFLKVIILANILASQRSQAATFPVVITSCNSTDWNIRAGVYDESVNRSLLAEAALFDYLAEKKSDKAELIQLYGDIAAGALSLVNISASYKSMSSTDVLTMGAGSVKDLLSYHVKNMPPQLDVAKVIFDEMIAAVQALTPPLSQPLTALYIADKASQAAVDIISGSQLYLSMGYSRKRAEIHGIRYAMRSFLVNCGDVPSVLSELAINKNEYQQCLNNNHGYSMIACPAYLYAKKDTGGFFHPDPNIARMDLGIRANLRTLNGIYSYRYGLLSDMQKQVNPENIAEFIDVPADSWIEKYVEPLRKRGIIQGNSEGLFEPMAAVTRAAFVKMLVEMYSLRRVIVTISQLPPAYASHSTKWYYPYVQQAYNIINDANLHEPVAFWGEIPPDFAANITREEAAHMLMNALELRKYRGTEALYTDVSGTSVENGWIRAIHDFEGQDSYGQTTPLMRGYKNGTFKPTVYLNRADAAKLLFEAFKVSTVLGGQS